MLSRKTTGQQVCSTLRLYWSSGNSLLPIHFTGLTLPSGFRSVNHFGFSCEWVPQTCLGIPQANFVVVELQLLLQQRNVCPLRHTGSILWLLKALGLMTHWCSAFYCVAPTTLAMQYFECSFRNIVESPVQMGQNHEHRKVRSLPIFGAVLAMGGNALKRPANWPSSRRPYCRYSNHLPSS